MKKRRKHKYYPPKEPCIYFLEVFLENKWQIFYIGETERLIQRLYNHQKEKKDWGLKGKCRYFSIPASKNVKTRRYYEAYLVVKFQPLHQQGAKMKQYITIVMSRRISKKTGRKLRALPVPGYGKYPVHPNNNCDFRARFINPKKTKEMQEGIDKMNREKFSNTALLAKNQNYIKNIQITDTKSRFLFHGAKMWAMNLKTLSPHDFKRAKFLLSVFENRARLCGNTSENYAKQRQNLPIYANHVKLTFEEIAIFRKFFSQNGDCLHEPLYCFEHASFVFEKTKDLVIKRELRMQWTRGKKQCIQAIQIQERLKELKELRIKKQIRERLKELRK